MQQRGRLEELHVASKARVGQGCREFLARSLFPHQTVVWDQETVPNVRVSAQRDVRLHRLWKVRRRRRRAGVAGYVGVVREGVRDPLDAAGTCAIVLAAASVTRADGRAYGGKACLGILQGVSTREQDPTYGHRAMRLHRVPTIRFHLVARCRARCSRWSPAL